MVDFAGEVVKGVEIGEVAGDFAVDLNFGFTV
jgi:hypothetical protein